MTPLFDQLGPHARAVSDVILFDAVVTGDAAPIVAKPLRGVTLAVARDYYFAQLDPEVSRLMEEALGKLKAAGARIVDVKILDLPELVGKTTFPIVLHDLGPSIAAYLPNLAPACLSIRSFANSAPTSRRRSRRRRVLCRATPTTRPLVLPSGLTRDGLPVGIEFDGPAGSDRALLALGLSLQKTLGAIPAPKIG